MSERRRVVAFYTMPERLSSADRIAHVSEDVQEATAALRRELTRKATTLSVNGFALDEESWEMAVNGRTVVGSAVVSR